MFNKKNILKLLLLIGILTIISIATISIFGNEYTFKINNFESINSTDDVVIKIEENDKPSDLVKIFKEEYNNNYLNITIKSSGREGKATITVVSKNEELLYLDSIYVHKFGIMSINEYLGKTRGSIVIPISICIFHYFMSYIIQNFSNIKATNCFKL